MKKIQNLRDFYTVPLKQLKRSEGLEEVGEDSRFGPGMTDLQYILRIFVPSEAARLSGQAAERELHLIRRALAYKVRTNARLTPVEQHLIHSFPQLKNKFFAPSSLAVMGMIARAFIRPAFACAALGLVLAGVSPRLGDPSGSMLAYAEPEIEAAPQAEPLPHAAAEPEVDLPQLALALASDKDQPELSSAETAGFELPVLPEIAVPVSEPQEPTKSFQQLEADAHLKQQRNLVRFISGIIAAFRPNIKDSGLIARHIVELSGTEKIDPIYVAAVIAIESRFSSTAESYAGAVGLMQLMPTTAKEVANSKHHRDHHLVDPRTNIKLGISYLKQLEEKYRGNRFLALAAYNWGPANIDKSSGKYKRIPGSVRKYSTTVLERTLAWRRHYDKASESADSLKTVSYDDTEKSS